MNVDRAETGNGQKRRSQDLSISRDDEQVGREFLQPGDRLVGVHIDRLKDLQPSGKGELFQRMCVLMFARAAPIGLRDEADDLMTRCEKRLQRWLREGAGADKKNAQRQR